MKKLPPTVRQSSPIIALILLTLIAYIPAMSAGFIWDDDAHITNNKDLLDLPGLARIWTRLGLENGGTPQFYPLTHTMFWIEHHLWGNAPAGYHIINILIHAISACLLWKILRTLDVAGAWMIAAVWAIHPVNVESVAWASERKNVLSGCLFFISILAYLQTLRDEQARRWWAISFAAFVLALLSKTTVSILPAVLMLILWWKRTCISPSPGTPGEGRGEGSLLRDESDCPHPNPLPDYRERGPELVWRRISALIPFFVVGAALGLLTAHIERRYVEAVGSDWDITFPQRVMIAGKAVWFYAGQLFIPIPSDLCFSYPRWNVQSDLTWIAPIAVIVALAILLVLGLRFGRSLAVAAFYFVGVSVPALGFFNVYPMRFSFVADHFQYLASIGFIGLIVGGISRLKLSRRFAISLSVVVLAVLSTFTWVRASEFYDSMTLWKDTIQTNPNSWLARFNLASELIPLARDETHQADASNDPVQANQLRDQSYRDYAEASSQLHEVLQLRPDHEKTHFALGVIAQLNHHPADAEREFQAEIAINPNYAPPYSNLGMLALSQNRLEDAHRLLTRATELDSLPPHGRTIPVPSQKTRDALAKLMRCWQNNMRLPRQIEEPRKQEDTKGTRREEN